MNGTVKITKVPYERRRIFKHSFSSWWNILWKGNQTKHGNTNKVLRCGQKLNEINLDDVIMEQWVSGGIGGGNCWGDGGYNLSSEEEPEFATLDALLEKICPKITHLEYKKMLNGLVNREETTKYEYYGNCTNYVVR